MLGFRAAREGRGKARRVAAAARQTGGSVARSVGRGHREGEPRGRRAVRSGSRGRAGWLAGRRGCADEVVPRGADPELGSAGLGRSRPTVGRGNPLRDAPTEGVMHPQRSGAFAWPGCCSMTRPCAAKSCDRPSPHPSSPLPSQSSNYDGAHPRPVPVHVGRQHGRRRRAEHPGPSLPAPASGSPPTPQRSSFGRCNAGRAPEAAGGTARSGREPERPLARQHLVAKVGAILRARWGQRRPRRRSRAVAGSSSAGRGLPVEEEKEGTRAGRRGPSPRRSPEASVAGHRLGRRRADPSCPLLALPWFLLAASRCGSCKRSLARARPHKD